MSINSSDMAMDHNLMITGLAPNTVYYYRVGSTDGNGYGPTTSNEGSFTTELDPDTTAPVIIEPPTVIEITSSTATVVWKTNESANSEVRFDSASRAWPNYPIRKTSANMSIDHKVTLAGLESGQRYYFRVGNTDVEGYGPDTDAEDNNPFSEASFLTDMVLDEKAPRITSTVLVSGIDDQSAIVIWYTDELSNSIVQYGTASSVWDNYFWTTSMPSMTKEHIVVLNDLQPDTTYWFRVGSIDAMGNGPILNPEATNPSPEETFTTLSGPDLIAPQIVLGPDITHVTNTTAQIEWTTNEPANSEVRFGMSAANWDNYPFQETDAGLRTDHRVTINLLQPNTLYYYRVASTDHHGNGPAFSSQDNNPSAEMTFQSAAGPDITAPQISNLRVSSKTDTTAIIEWSTDEPGNSQVGYDTERAIWQEYAFRKNVDGMTTDHSVTLTNLSPATLYYVRVSSTDASGNNSDLCVQW
jgi:phosphodiesterase/alkaline phosphatase D-like protein